MFVKVSGEQVIPNYTIEDLRLEHPNVSFPLNITDDILTSFNVFRVKYLPAPGHDSRTHRLVTQFPTLIDGVWTVSYVAVEKDQAQINSETLQAARTVRSERDRLLAATDWRFRSDMNPSQEWIDYCQALRNVPQQEGFPFNVQWPTMPN